MPATQIERPFRLKTPLGDDALLLNSFTGYERVSTPYRFVFELLTDDVNVDMKGLLTKPAVLSIKLEDESERHIHGIINRMKLVEYGDDGLAAYQAEMVPWFWFLTLFSNCRIFQNKSVPDIVEKVFTDRGFTDYDLKLQGTYQPREYCVQYRETDFNFVSRLLEEEGIFYFFEQSEAMHKLVLADDKSAFVSCPTKSSARYAPALGGHLESDTVLTVEEEHKINTGKISMTDYDFEKSQTNLYATLSGSDEGASDEAGEDYDYPGRYKTKSDGDRYVKIRLEEREVHLVTVRGKSNCMGFECGYKFTMEEHVRDAVNQDYTLLALRHQGKNSSYRSGDTQPFEYTNEFEAIPNLVPFRPPRLARKPVIPSTQTAVVVGKSGEEIWVDKYGRIKVQFFWDREGTDDEKSSCWIRVAQGWAGKNWGIIHLPRIGQEVVVSFLEGDPDRPLVTGSVYNDDQMPPYTLPDEQTKSTLKSMSSKGGGGFNEIRLEDKKGSEQVFINGEKNLDIQIKNDRQENIGNNRSLTVTNDKMEKVGRDSHVEVARDMVQKFGRDHHLEIDGKAAVKITGSHSLAVNGDVIEQFAGNHSSQVTQNLYLKAMQVVIEGSTGLTLKVGGNFITLDPSGIAISGSPIVQINSAGSALSGSAGSLVSPISPTAPVAADTANPGAVTTAPSASAATQLNMSLANITPAPPHAAAPPASATHNPASEENKDKTHWIEIELLDEAGKPVPGEVYHVTLPDGSTIADGTLDEKGRARVEHIDPGTCKVTFPNLDKDAWEPK
ncbi:MAG TPA: type VI secretion system tip protein VgrG [Bryobacteraceae bacterium]|nr:type VI secretion system tip protein VgrG [Bryobacteraceae bacterium]